jgi:hypothetical protein
MKKTEIEALPTKGKPEEFFEHKGLDFEPNEEQMIFVGTYYPQYSSGPHLILD